MATIKAIVNTCGTSQDFLMKLIDIWEQSDTFGTFMDTPIHCVTAWEGWTIVSNRKNKLVTFIDSENEEVVCIRRGTKYTDLRLYFGRL